MGLQNRIKKLESVKLKNHGWYTFNLLENETVEDGRKRVGIPENAENVISIRGGLPPDPEDPPYFYYAGMR